MLNHRFYAYNQCAEPLDVLNGQMIFYIEDYISFLIFDGLIYKVMFIYHTVKTLIKGVK